MLIFVVLPTGQQIAVDVFASWTIYRVKSKLFEDVRIPPILQRLIFGTVELEGGTVASNGIPAESTLHLTLRIAGGAGGLLSFAGLVCVCVRDGWGRVAGFDLAASDSHRL